MVVDTFPKRSEVAIFNQVRCLLDRGCEVDVFAEGCEDGSQAMLESLPQQPTMHWIPRRPLCRYSHLALNRINLLICGLARAARTAMSAPGATLQAMNIPRFGRYARSFWLVYQLWPFVSRPSKTPYNVVHAQFGPNGVRAMLLRELGVLNAGIITSFRGYDLNKLPREHGTDMYRDLFEEGEFFTTDSIAMGRKLAALGCPAEKIRVLPSSIDLSFWKRRQANDGSSARPWRVLSASRLVACKGLQFMLQALKLVSEQRPQENFDYVIAGDGPLRQELEKLAGELGLSNVRFVGWVDQAGLRRLCEESDLFVMPSIVTREGDEESQGLVLQEAQAMELPVVASRVGGIPEGLVDGVTGLLCEPDNSADLALKLIGMLQRRPEWIEMGQKARSFVAQKFSAEEQTNRLIDLYHECAASRALKPGNSRAGIRRDAKTP